MVRTARWPVFVVCLLAGGAAGTFVANPLLRGQVHSSPVAPKELTSYRDVVKQVVPAVVSIESRTKPKTKARVSQPNARRRVPLDDSQIPEEFRRFFEEFGGRQFEMPQQGPRTGFGSGFIIDPKGVVLTNHHVVDGADEVEVQLKDGRKFVTKDIHSDAKTDLAIVRFDPKGSLPYLELGDSDAMEVGDRVLAVGAPFGLAGSVTHGIISAKGRNGFFGSPGEIHYEDFLQTDAAINPGNSGGPLINLEGKVVGINSAIKSRNGGFQGVGLAIASNLAKGVVPQLEKDGVVRRGYLGVQIKDLEGEVAARLGVKGDTGVAVSQVFDGSPAAKAGLQPGDVVTAVAGKQVKDGRELQRTIANLPLNKPADLTVVRDGQTKHLTVTIQEQPEDFGTARATPPRSVQPDKDALSLHKLGVDVADLTAEMADQLGYKGPAKGALIVNVEDGGPAYTAGLRRGMLITKVDKHAVSSAATAKDVLEKASLADGVLLQLQSPQGGTSYVVIKVENVK